jgi:D-sedoheptulose 7-phosphate isomerase
VQQLRSLVERDDLVIALSGSGNSENVIRAIAYAQECGAKTIGLLAFKTGGKLGGMVDCPIIINTKHYGPAEDMQLVLNHILTACFAKQKQHLDGSTDTPDNKSVPYR